MPLNILQRTGRPLATKNDPAPNELVPRLRSSALDLRCSAHTVATSYLWLSSA